MTIVEKILAAHSNKKVVVPGEFITAKIDLCFANDITGPLAIEEFKRMGAKKIFSATKVAFVLDHFVPAKDIKAAEQCQKVKSFAKANNIRYLFDASIDGGIEHIVIPDEGLVAPGEIVIGADSHTTTLGALGAFACGVGSTDLACCMALGELWLRVPESIKVIYYGRLARWVVGKDLILYTIGKLGVSGANYKALELGGETMKNLTMADRFSICNMAAEAGAKCAIIEPDEITLQFVNKLPINRAYKIYRSDKDANYSQIIEIDCQAIEPMVALPHSPGNVLPAAALTDTIRIDQAVIGSCTNGRIEDLRQAAKILKDRKKQPDVRLIIIPGSQKVYRQALSEGLLEIFLDCGAVISPATCGPCLGAHMGVLASGERCIATTNRNFIGRMGHTESEVYLASPYVVAASAVLGRIASPAEIIN